MTPPAAAAAEVLPRTRTTTRRPPTRRVTRHPRRVSGPGRSAQPAEPARSSRSARASGPPRGLALRVLDLYRLVANSVLVDRLVRGRLWIGLLAFALIGIVAMQLMVLKLNAGIGATLEREASLQRENAQLGIEAATSAGEGRVQPLAAAEGMVFAAPGSVHFVAAGPAYVSQAAAALSQPIQPHESASPSAGEAVAGEASALAAGGSEPARSESTSAESGESSESEPAQPGSTRTESAATESRQAEPPPPNTGEAREAGGG